MKKKEVVNYLFKNNDKTYNLLKAAEELQELSLAIIQHVTKEGLDDTNIIEEIGDVEIRLTVAKKYFSNKKVQERVKYKLKSIKKHLKTGKYKNKT